MIEGWIGRLKLVSSRFTPIFLIIFGVTGLVVWPISGAYLTATIGGAESALGSALMGLQGVERMLNESYLKLEGLEESMEGFAGGLEGIAETVNLSSASILEVSESLDAISLTLIQASEIWALRLISEEFADSLRSTGESLRELSQTVQEIKLQELLSEFKAIEAMVKGGIEILSFLKALINAFLTIIKTVIGRINVIKATIGTIKNTILILIVDAALIHLSIALVGVTFRQKRLNER